MTVSVAQLSVSGKLMSHILGSVSGGKCRALCLHVCLRCSRLLLSVAPLSYHCKEEKRKQQRFNLGSLLQISYYLYEFTSLVRYMGILARPHSANFCIELVNQPLAL